MVRRAGHAEERLQAALHSGDGCEVSLHLKHFQKVPLFSPTLLFREKNFALCTDVRLLNMLHRPRTWAHAEEEEGGRGRSLLTGDEELFARAGHGWLQLDGCQERTRWHWRGR